MKRKNHEWFMYAVLLLCALILLLRFFHLDSRTIHIDEGMGLLLGEQMLNGEWHYNPQNAHGPIYFFLGAFSVSLFQYSIVAARALTSLVSVLSLGLLYWGYRSQLRTPGKILLLAGLGLSSGMTFYARFFIHEYMFILVTVGALLAGEWWVRKRNPYAPVMFLLLCSLMYATKETAILTWAAWTVTAGLLLLKKENRPICTDLNWKIVGIGAVGSAVTSALLFSVFFDNPQAIIDSFTGPLHWFERAQDWHAKPFLYFVQLLWRNEFPLFFSAIGLAIALTAQKKWTPRLHFFWLWTVGILLAYSSIRYKTPWCIPNIILPLGLFVALAADALWSVGRKKKQELLWILIGSILLSVGFINAWLDTIGHPDRVEPYDYAYMQSDESLRRLIRTLEDLNTLYSEVTPLPIQKVGRFDELLVILSKPYIFYNADENLRLGLPVYMNYFHDDADTLRRITQSGKHYIRSTYTYMRDWGTLVDLFVEEALWDRYLQKTNQQKLPGKNPVYDYR